MKVMKVVCATALAALCSLGLASCNGTESSDEGTTDIYDTSGGVAVTVNGTELGEKAITTYIANFRASSDLQDDSAWAQWLVDNDYTVESVREQVINYYVSQELIRQAAAENGVTVDSAEIDSQVESVRSYYSSDEEWKEALSSLGMTEESYRSMLELSTLQQGLQEKVATATEPSEEDLLQYAQMYATAYDGAKKSSHILFSSDDQSTAQEVLDKINAGELDFADAAQQYSQDDVSAQDGGNVGWDKLTSFVTEYQEALDGLEEGQVSGLVTSSYGIHIIKCTEVFVAPEEVTSIDQLPSEFIDTIKSYLEESSKSQAYSDWYDNYKESADIVINDMPSGLPYDVDLSNVTKSVEEETVTPTVPGSTTSDSSDDASSSDADASTDASEASASDSSSSDSSSSSSSNQVSEEKTAA